MMIDRKGAATLLFVCGIVCYPRISYQEPRAIMPTEFLAMGDAVAVLELTRAGEPGQGVECRTLGVVKGQLGTTLTLVYPSPDMEATVPFVMPRKGTILLAFLKREDDDRFSVCFGYRGLAAVGRGDVNTVIDLVRQYLEWKKLKGAQKACLVRASLMGPGPMRRFARDWLLIDNKVDFDKTRLSDEMVEGLLACLDYEDVSIRRSALLAVSMAAGHRTDLIAYLVDSLDDPVLRSIAMVRLDGRTGWAPGPAFDPADTIEKKATILKKWWKEKGSKNPVFKRYVPKPADDRRQ